MPPTIRIGGIVERDVDRVLVGLSSDQPNFANWFCGRCKGENEGPVTVQEVGCSVIHSLGESDVEVLLLVDGERLMLLIEDKVGASFQPEQAERYRRRGESLIADGHCDHYKTVLVASETYLGPDGDHAHGFDAVVRLEEISAWISEASDGASYHYPSAVLSAAIAKSASGYNAELDDVSTGFWNEYWRLVQATTTYLEMDDPGGRPRGSGFAYFRSSALPPRVRLIHKFVQGNVDLQFAGLGQKLGKVAERFEGDLPENYSLARAHGSGVIRCRVSELDPGRPFESQRAAAAEGIEAAEQLLRWFSSARRVASPGEDD